VGNVLPHRKHFYGLPQSVTGINLLFLYVDGVLTIQKIRLWASTVSYRDSFTFLYVEDFCTSQESHSVMGIALLFYM
jgi:hypothetical protein